jgi:transposase-like protein
MENHPHPIQSVHPAPQPASAEARASGDESPRSSGLRRRTPPEVRQALLDEFESLGLSARQFARQRNLCYQTLLSWIRARRQEKGSGAGSDCGFAEVVLDSEKAGSGGILSIRLPGGAVLEIRNRNELPAAAELLSLLEKC